MTRFPGTPAILSEGFRGVLGRVVCNQGVRKVPELPNYPASSKAVLRYLWPALGSVGWISLLWSIPSHWHFDGRSSSAYNLQTRHNLPACVWPLRNLTLCNNKTVATLTLLPCLNPEPH